MNNMKPKRTGMSACSILLALFMLNISCDSDHQPHSAGGQPVTLNIGSYPQWQGEEPQPGSRTITYPTDDSKTYWVKGDKVWIRMVGVGGTTPLVTGTATYNGQTWETDLRWPVGVDRAQFQAYYIGSHEPEDGKGLSDTDVLYAYNLSSVAAGNPVPLSNFQHLTNRITITYTAAVGEKLYLSGNGFEEWQMNANYSLIPRTLHNEYLELTGSPATVYLYFVNGGFGTRQVYRSTDGGSSHTLAGSLTFSPNNIYGYSYSINLGSPGGVTPGDMNEEQQD